MGFDHLDAPTGEFIARAPPYVTPRGPNWALPANACTSDYLAASVFAVPVAPLPGSTEGTEPARRATSSEPSPSPTNGDAPHSSSGAGPVSSTVALDKATSVALPPALPAHHDSAEHPTYSGPQDLSVVSHSASRVSRTSRDQVSVVPAASPLLSSSSQTALPSLPLSGLISSRTRRRQVAAAGKPTTTVDYGFARSHPIPLTVPRPAPTACKPRPPRATSPSEVHRPCSGSADSTHHRCGHTCSALA